MAIKSNRQFVDRATKNWSEVVELKALLRRCIKVVKENSKLYREIIKALNK